ncbi:MAG: polyketide cyclase, partial [Chloroflexota bacterium]
MSDYAFTTVWRTRAPLEAVWQEIYDTEAWPSWWKGVEQVITLREGEADGLGSVYRYTWKSKLPYRLTFDMEIVTIEPPRCLEGVATGELVGRGCWHLWTEGDETIVRYDWIISTTKRWMNTLAVVARPLFRWNHDVVMGWGAEGLSQRL